MIDTRNNILNPYVSILQIDKEQLIFSLCGKIKRIKGNFTILNDLRGAFGEVPDEIIQKLLLSNVLIPSGTTKPTLTRRVLIFGEGRLASACQMIFSNQGSQVEVRPFEHFLKRNDAIPNEITAGLQYLFCPGEATVSDLLEVNRRCLSLGSLFNYFFFDGTSLVIGPMVTLQSPCLECLFTWQYKSVLDNTELGLSQADLGAIQAAYPYESSEMAPVLRSADLISSQMLNAAALIDEENSLVRQQWKISTMPELEYSKTKFEGISRCNACHGRLVKTYYSDRELFLSEADSGFALHEVPTVHSENGYRFLDASKAKELIDSALGKAGTYSILELRNGGLDDVLPTYVSTLTTEDKVIKGFGKGISRQQAYLSAGFETIERLCSQPRANLPMLNASWRDVKDTSLNVREKIGTVYFNRHVDTFSEDAKIDWVWGNSIISQRPLLIPASMVFIGPSRFSGRFYVPSTGGIAAGTSFEDALLQGLLELIEHDAWMIWQANATDCPSLAPDSIENQEALRIIKGFKDNGYKVIIRYLATDLGIPVFKVWLVQPNSVEVFAAQGLGCHLNRDVALLRALTEAKVGMPQKIYKKAGNTKFMSRGNRDILDSRHSLFYLHHFVKTDMCDSPYTLRFDSIQDLSTNDILGDIEIIKRALRDKIEGIEIAVVNLSDEYLAIPVVRVVATGLQQLSQPTQSVQERLFSVPSKLYGPAYRKSYNELFNGRFQF
jgi:thiazole/oxazole-forming peptide maturase SagD family component